jgi:hypothetical protein
MDLFSFFGALGAVLFLPLSVFLFQGCLFDSLFPFCFPWGSFFLLPVAALSFTPPPHSCYGLLMVQLQKIKIRSMLDFSPPLYFRSHIALP